MKKADYQAKLEELGLDTEGTVKELKARLAEVPDAPLVTSAAKPKVSGRGRESDARKAYRTSAHTPKTRRGPRNEQRPFKK